MERVLLDLKSDAGRDAFLRLAAKADVVIESFRPGVMDRLGLGDAAVRAVNPAHRLLLDERLRPDRPAFAVGRPRSQLPRGRRLSRLLRPRRRRRSRAARRDDRRRRGRRHAGRHRDPRRARAARGDRRGRVPRRLGRRRRGRAHVAVRRRVLRDRRGARPAPQHPHRPLRVLRRLPLRRRPLDRGRRDRAALLREPVPRARLRAVARAPDRRRGAGRDPRRLRGRDRRPRRATSGSRELGPADTCVSEVASVPELVHDAHLRARNVFVEATAPEHGDVRTGRLGARGHGPRPARARRARRDGHRHRRAACAKSATRPRRSRPYAKKESPRERSAARGREADRRGAVRGGGRVPGRARLHLHDVLVGRERQPAVLGRRRSRRRSRRADRAADDDLGVVPPAPVVARAAPSPRCRCRRTST